MQHTGSIQTEPRCLHVSGVMSANPLPKDLDGSELTQAERLQVLQH